MQTDPTDDTVVLSPTDTYKNLHFQFILPTEATVHAIDKQM